MQKLREINREIFRENLLKTINEIKFSENLLAENLKFNIIPIEEPGKLLDGKDDQMRLIALSEKNVGNRLLCVEDATRLLSCKAPFVPIWINVSFIEEKEGISIFKLETSLRFRKPSLLMNAETGHAPFKAILE